jgi:glycosyltransferase involved in cell wall biosynthesis
MFSLIVATCSRVTEPERLLASLAVQTYRRFEVIVVDQNPDDRLVPVLAKYPQLAIRHLRCAVGAARARNVGLKAAQGDIVAFPDDDCWYPVDLLSKLVSWFGEHPEFDGLFTAVRNPQNKLMAPKFPPREGPVTKKNVLRCAMAITTFLRAAVVKTIGFFREDIGPGTLSPFQSGEDLDYMIRPLEYGFRLWYQPSLSAYHPDIDRKKRDLRTAYSYALGVGLVWRVHGYSWDWCLGEIVVRSLGGAAFHLFKGDLRGCVCRIARSAGEFRGYAIPFPAASAATINRQ